MTEINETGGARIGLANATWPLAKLIVSKDKLELKASIIGDLVFKPGDVISIQPYTVIPLLGQGIRIIHNVSNYNPKVIFWTMGSPSALMQRIAETGFMTNGNPIPPALQQEIVEAQASGGFPLKTSAAIAIVVIWNLLILSGFLQVFNGAHKDITIGFGARAAPAFILLTCLGLLTSQQVRDIILKPGRSLDSIKSFLYLLMFISGIMFLVLCLVPS